MKVLLLFFIGCVLFYSADAQLSASNGVWGVPARSTLADSLSVDRDPRLDKMLKWHIEKNTERKGIDGFRVEIFFSSSMDARKQALEVKTSFLSEYPDYPVHVKFIAPNFRVRVGDFRTKNEAWKLYREIQKQYPTAFVVPDIINFPPLKATQYE